jgi:hypothetical protein
MLGLEEAAVLLEEAPDIELRGGLYYVTDHIGDGTIVRVMRPNVFFRLFARAGEAARLHKFAGAEIIDFPGKEDAPAHA